MNVIPATMTLKADPHQTLYFLSKTHQADARGLLFDVPYDTAVILIKNKSAVEATEADIEADVPDDETPAAEPEAPAPATTETVPAPAPPAPNTAAGEPPAGDDA